MSVVIDQPNSNGYFDPLSNFIMSMGFDDEFALAKRMDLILQETGIDHRGLPYWQMKIDDFETSRTLATAFMNSDGLCTVSRVGVGGTTHAVAKIQLAVATMYTYEFPFATLRAVDQPSPLGEFHRKVWGIWLNTPDSREVASYVMSTSEQCRLCCVGTVTGHDYEMAFECDGGHVAENADVHGRVLCMLTLISLGCYNMVTFFNPKSPPPKRRKRRR